MADSEPICETEKASFCVEILKRLNTQRGQGYLCDITQITLVAKEGKEFKAHRNVLSAASPYFAMRLRSEMREKEEGVIRFEQISASILEDVLEFIYTGNIKIDDKRKAKDLIIGADYLLLICLKTIATRFLEERLTIFNCVSTFYFAEKYQCGELVVKSRTLILEKFASVAEVDEFLNLEAEEVASWISSDEICVAAGSMVCVNGTLYVLGGLHSWSPEYTVESYDPTANEWTQKTTIPVDKIPEYDEYEPSFKGCALKFPIEVLEKLRRIDLHEDSELEYN